MIVVRYAGDTVVGFEHRSDAERFLAAVRNRMAEFALELHPDKTRLIEFGRNAAANRATRGVGKPETFDFLGFTHICSRSKKGGFVLARHTRRDRKMAKLLEIKEDLRRRWHQDTAEQGEWLGAVVRDFFAYHAVPTNTRALSSFRYHVLDLWRRALRRRSQRDRTTWKRMGKLVDRWLHMPRISHPWPSRRLTGNTVSTAVQEAISFVRAESFVWRAATPPTPRATPTAPVAGRVGHWGRWY